MSETPDVAPTQIWNDKDLALRWFEFDHLPEDLKAIASQVYDLADALYDDLGSGPEKSAGLRKLLEAKDCFVRQAVADRPHTLET